MELTDFLSIIIIDTEGITFYGEVQSWFSTNTARDSACGTVAAANTLAYLAIKHSGLKALYSGESIGNITKMII